MTQKLHFSDPKCWPPGLPDCEAASASSLKVRPQWGPHMKCVKTCQDSLSPVPNGCSIAVICTGPHLWLSEWYRKYFVDRKWISGSISIWGFWHFTMSDSMTFPPEAKLAAFNSFCISAAWRGNKKSSKTSTQGWSQMKSWEPSGAFFWNQQLRFIESSLNQSAPCESHHSILMLILEVH